MIEYNKIKECLDAIFHPDYEKYMLTYDIDNYDDITFFVQVDEDKFTICVGGFKEKAYDGVMIVDKNELYEAFDHAYGSYLMIKEEMHEVTFILTFYDADKSNLEPIAERRFRKESLGIANQFFRAIVESIRNG